MSTTITEIVRLKKHKDADIYYDFNWATHWLRDDDSLSEDIEDHSFEPVDAGSGLTIDEAFVVGNVTFCRISGGNPSIAEWRVRIAVKGTSDPIETGVVELWITVWGD